MDEAGNYSGLSSVILASTTGLVPAAMTVAGGDEQVGPGGSALPQPLSVVVTDDAGRGVSGVPVTFSLLEGAPGAFLTPETVLSDADGVASSMLTLGTIAPGVAGVLHRVTASADGLAPLELRSGAHALIDLMPVWETDVGDEPIEGIRALDISDADGDGLGEIVVAVFDRDAAGSCSSEARKPTRRHKSVVSRPRTRSAVRRSTICNAPTADRGTSGPPPPV